MLEDWNLQTIVRLFNSVFQPYDSVATNLLFFTKGEPTQNVWFYEHKLPEGYKPLLKNQADSIGRVRHIEKLVGAHSEANKQDWLVDIDTIKANG